MFLLSAVVFVVGQVIFALRFPNDSTAAAFLLISLTSALILNVVAEVCLCEILFLWSTKSPDDEIGQQDNESGYHALETAECDEEFETNARIWNVLVNRRLNQIEAERIKLRASQHSRKNRTNSQASEQTYTTRKQSTVQLLD